jgi:hypothetical protein
MIPFSSGVRDAAILSALSASSDLPIQSNFLLVPSRQRRPRQRRRERE